MAVGFGFGVLPSILPGEKVLGFKKWIWALSGKSLPSYRLFFSIPPLWEAGVYVTDRRILFVAYVARLIRQEVSLWFEGRAEPGDRDFVKDISSGRGRLLGPYLQVISLNTQKHWYRSPWLRVRVFMKHPKLLQQAISAAMMPQSKSC
jgi:hypothetical protein